MVSLEHYNIEKFGEWYKCPLQTINRPAREALIYLTGEQPEDKPGRGLPGVEVVTLLIGLQQRPDPRRLCHNKQRKSCRIH